MSRVWGHPLCVRSLVYRQTTKPRQSARDLLSWEFITVEQRKVVSYFRFCQGVGEEQKSRPGRRGVIYSGGLGETVFGMKGRGQCTETIHPSL